MLTMLLSKLKTIRHANSALPRELLPVLTALLLTVFYNQPLLGSLEQLHRPGLVFAVIALLFCLNWLLAQLLGSGRLLKPWLIVLLSLSAIGQYFMLQYGILLDKGMLLNALETDPAEISGLLSWKMLPYLLGYGVLPALLITYLPLKSSKHFNSWRSFLPLFSALLLLMVLVSSQFQSYAGVFREHRYLKHQALPLSALTASAGLIKLSHAQASSFTSYAADARQQLASGAKPRLIIMVLGETVRADHLGINGYNRNTTPKLSKRELLNLGAINACGTATAKSVPCLFSYLLQENYDETLAKNSDNLLDVLQRAGVKVIWRNNNSGCKSMCDRVTQDKDYALSSQYQCPDGACPDLALLHQLPERIRALSQPDESVLVVLHQQGNHGPEYYKRSLPQYKAFLPECETNLLSDCSSEQITNAYDNAILQTDILLDEVINIAEQFSDGYDTAMIYLSDHGESLGENGVYLHGLPYWMAPAAQTEVPLLFWLSEGLKRQAGISPDCLNRTEELSHDHIFDSLLSLFAVDSKAKRQQLDLFANCYPNS
ncbi:MAG: phosphoethanolamine transferase [Alishewanella aestuarii]